jgi:hypothetical protein
MISAQYGWRLCGVMRNVCAGQRLIAIAQGNPTGRQAGNHHDQRSTGQRPNNFIATAISKCCHAISFDCVRASCPHYAARKTWFFLLLNAVDG